jgi:hypothetical protein
MSKLDQPLRLKHGIAAAVAALALGVAGTAIPMATAGGGGGDTLHYRAERFNNVPANSQRGRRADCPPGTKVVGGGVKSSAGFRSGSGMMINTSAPFDDGDGNGNPDDGWKGLVDIFQNAGGENIVVYAICKG